MVGVELDIDDPASLARTVAELASQCPDLNMLVANAGISAAEDLAAEDWDTAGAEALIATNIVGTLRTIAAVLPLLKRRRDGVVLVDRLQTRFRAARGLCDLLRDQGLPPQLAAGTASSAPRRAGRGA